MIDDRKEILSPEPVIEVVYAGGTISSLATDEGHREGGHAVDLVSLLEERSPDFHADFQIGNKEIAYTGLSENTTEEDLEVIDEKVESALNRSPRGIALTCGTDAMEQIARHIDSNFGARLREKDIRLVLIAANDDIEHPETDAWDNLQFGLESAVSGADAGVYVGFHQRLVPADEVVKIPYIDGGDPGFISKHDPEYIRLLHQQMEHSARLNLRLKVALNRQPNDALAMNYDVNVMRSNHDDLLEYLDNHHPQAILMTLYHSGTANTETPGQSVAELVQKLRESKGITCFGVTENGEAVDLHQYETSVKLREAGLVPLYDMPKEAALMKLQLAGPELSRRKLISYMLTSVAGEIDQTKIIQDDIDALKQMS